MILSGFYYIINIFFKQKELDEMFFHNLTCYAAWNHNYTMFVHLVRGGLVP